MFQLNLRTVLPVRDFTYTPRRYISVAQHRSACGRYNDRMEFQLLQCNINIIIILNSCCLWRIKKQHTHRVFSSRVERECDCRCCCCCCCCCTERRLKLSSRCNCANISTLLYLIHCNKFTLIMEHLAYWNRAPLAAQNNIIKLITF